MVLVLKSINLLLLDCFEEQVFIGRLWYKVNIASIEICLFLMVL